MLRYQENIQAAVLRIAMNGAKRRQAVHSARITFQLTSPPIEVIRIWTIKVKLSKSAFCCQLTLGCGGFKGMFEKNVHNANATSRIRHF